MGFSGSVNGTTKNPGFFYFGFCQCKWAYGGNCLSKQQDLEYNSFLLLGASEVTSTIMWDHNGDLP